MNDSKGFNWGLPESASTYAPQVDAMLGLLHWVMVGIFVLWGIYFVFCLIRYRERPGERATYHQTGENLSFIPDGLILLFELWLIFAFGIPMWTSIKQQTPPPESSLLVKLVGQQFAWNFHYPGPDGKFGRTLVSLVSPSNPVGLDDSDPDAKDDILSVNNLVVPEKKPVVLEMTSRDVIHNFAVAQFRNKQDLVPGLKTSYWFEATRTGTFEIGCSQLCGLGHTRMRGDVIVKTAADYDAWVKEQEAAKASTAAAPGEPSSKS